jgi:hypothetical protein
MRTRKQRKMGGRTDGKKEISKETKTHEERKEGTREVRKERGKGTKKAGRNEPSTEAANKRNK